MFGSLLLEWIFLGVFMEILTKREQEILDLIMKGMRNKTIGDELGMATTTVKWHITNLFKKTGARSRAQLIVLWNNKKSL